MRHGDVFNVDGADPLAARLDHVLAAVSDLHEAIGINRGHVTRGEPAPATRILDERVTALALEIAAHNPRALDQQIAVGLAIPRQFFPIAAHDLHVHAINGAALLLHDLHLLVLGQGKVLVLQGAQRAQRAHLGHAPGVQHRDAIAFLEGRDHGRRAGRATNHRALERRERQPRWLHVAQQHLPHGGHACGVGHLLGFDQFVNRLAIEGGAGKTTLHPVRAAE